MGGWVAGQHGFPPSLPCLPDYSPTSCCTFLYLMACRILSCTFSWVPSSSHIPPVACSTCVGPLHGLHFLIIFYLFVVHMPASNMLNLSAGSYPFDPLTSSSSPFSAPPFYSLLFSLSQPTLTNISDGSPAITRMLCYCLVSPFSCNTCCLCACVWLVVDIAAA